MKLVQAGQGLKRSPNVPNGPTLQVLFGGEEGSPDVGVVRTSIPVGGGMPEHNHGGSDVVLLVLTRTLELKNQNEALTVTSGDAVLIRKNERVSLRNVGDTDADAIVSVGPPTFLTGVRAWPEPKETQQI